MRIEKKIDRVLESDFLKKLIDIEPDQVKVSLTLDHKIWNLLEAMECCQKDR